jgi:tetratricopeptide (TPR) repeat protein
MSLRRLVALIALVGGCAHSPKTPPSSAGASITPAGPVGTITTEEDYATARGEYDALLVHSPERVARRAALETWLGKQLNEALDRGHLEEAYEQLKQAVTLYDPEELAGKVKDDGLYDNAVRIERAFKKRGAHEEVLIALVVEMKLKPNDASVRARYDEVVGWMRAGGATESEISGATVDGRGRVIEDLETVSRLWPSPFVVDELTRLYYERHQAGLASDPLGLGRRPRGGRGGAADLRQLLQGGPRPSTAYDLARLYLRISRPDQAVQKLQAIQTPQPGDEQIRGLIEKWAGKQATPPDAINVAGLLAQGHDDADVAQRVCVDATARFPNAPEPHLCAGEIANARDQLVVAMREFEAARQMQPGNREIWQRLARLWERRLFALVSDEQPDLAQLEPQLKKVEAFHAAAQKQFPGEPLKPTMAGALFEVGRGYFNAGHTQKAMEYFERSIAVEPQALTLEQMATIKLKKGEAKEAASLFERAIAVPKSEKVEQVYWTAKLRRELGDAYEAAGDAAAAETARKAALADWDQLGQIGTLSADGRAESGIERAKLYYQLGDRDQSIANFESAIDAAPDRGGTYADVIAFLVPRGELDEALDAYHRALGRNEVTEYLKVYCSLWIVDLARRAKQPVDPLASSYLASTDGGKWYDDLARWATGRETEQQMLARVDTPAKKAESSYYRAMRAIEAGDADQAKKLWKEVVDTEMMAFFEYDMAQMFLKLGNAPARPLLKSKGTYKPTAPTVKPPEGSI